MKLSKIQNRFINNKHMGFTILKGKTGSGKTTASIYRALNLENNYCIQTEDKILYVTSNDNNLAIAEKIYNDQYSNNHFYSLFSLDEPRVTFSSIDKLIELLYISNDIYNNSNNSFISKSEILRIVNNPRFNGAYFNYSKKSKVLNTMSLEDLVNEILWIKASNLTFDQYMDVERKGRPRILRKGSTTRQYIYDLKELYNKDLRDNNYIDEFDKVNLLVANLNKTTKYSHIIVDDIENFTKSEIELITSLCTNNLGTSITFILNSDPVLLKENSWLVKGRNIKSIFNGSKLRSYIFKNIYAKEIVKVEDSMEKYKYINFKNKNIVEFNIDSFNPKRELYTLDNETYTETELMEVPIYTNIAAGNPIEINEGIVGNFDLPTGWLERGKDSFILGVKGNSMIDKDICNGDYVVVKKQSTANNNDIVAATVDGEATLKTLKLDNKTPMLMPANKNFSPIYIYNREVSILGVVIGVIKHLN